MNAVEIELLLCSSPMGLISDWKISITCNRQDKLHRQDKLQKKKLVDYLYGACNETLHTETEKSNIKAGRSTSVDITFRSVNLVGSV